MAQRKRPSRLRAKRGLTRAGILGPRGVAFACVGLALVVALGAFVRMSQDSGVLVSHGENDGQAMEQAGSQGGGPSSPSDASSADDGATGAQVAETQGDVHEKTATVTVHVDGAVVAPGVYTLTQSPARTIDAVEAAGGLTTEADTGAINLAQALDDGAKVHIPAWGEVVEETAPAPSTASSSAGVASSGGASSSGTSSASASGGKVNINTATADELTSLPGVGPSTAQSIVDDRNKNGKFTSVEDLMRVSGIGEKKFAKLKDSIRV